MNTKTAVQSVEKMLKSKETYIEDRRDNDLLRDYEISGDFKVLINDQLALVISTELYTINIYGMYSGKKYFSLKSKWKNTEKLVQMVNDRIFK